MGVLESLGSVSNLFFLIVGVGFGLYLAVTGVLALLDNEKPEGHPISPSQAYGRIGGGLAMAGITYYLAMRVFSSSSRLRNVGIQDIIGFFFRF